MVTLQSKIKLQDCLLTFFFTLQNKLYPISCVSLIKSLSQSSNLRKLLLLHQKIIRLRRPVTSSLFIQVLHPEAINWVKKQKKSKYRSARSLHTELRALTRPAVSDFPELCREPASGLVGKAHADRSGTGGQQPRLTRPTAQPSFLGCTHQQWFNLKGKAVSGDG